MPSNERKEAADLLLNWLQNGVLPTRAMSAEHRGPLVSEMVYGVLRNRTALDFLIRKACRDFPDEEVRVFLYIGLYQLLFLDGVPQHAAVHTTVGAAKSCLSRFQAGFVNAVLRRAQRELAAWRAELEAQPAATRFSHPPGLVERWTRSYGGEVTDRICRWDNTRPLPHLRVVAERISVPAFCDALTEAGIGCRPHADRPGQVVVLDRIQAVDGIPGFADGWFYVMDASTLAAPELLEAQPGERVLDACAAPGGKCVMLAEAMKGRGCLVAVERSSERADRLRENLLRMKRHHVQVEVCDLLNREPDAPFDAVLLDVPCTNSGVIRRRPEARWRFSAKTLDAFAVLQFRLLDAASRMLRPGGRLVYSTCSSLDEENGNLVQEWLEGRPEFTRTRSIRMLPGERDMDGGYAALLRRGASGGG